MIRILHVVHSMDCGGTENIIMNLYRNINREDIQFDFLVHTNKECFFDGEIEELGGKIYRVSHYKMYNLLRYRKELHALFSQHKEWIAVHGHLGSCACVYLTIANKYGLYTIAHSHAINEKQINLVNLLYQFHAYLSRGVADFYMACSLEAGIDRYGRKIVKSNNFKIIKNGIKAINYIYNPKVREDLRQLLHLKDKYVVGHVGRFCAVKNHGFMINILVELKKISNEYCLICVGDGELRKSFEQKAKELGVDASVILTGIRKDIPNILQAMDCFIFPSFNEGLGIALIEAQAAGLPCIANKDGIIPLAKITDLVEFISLKEGAAAWAQQIHRVCQAKIQRKNMINSVITSGFDIDDVVSWISNFYLNLKK